MTVQTPTESYAYAGPFRRSEATGRVNLPTTLPPAELRSSFPALAAACDEFEKLQGESRDVHRALTGATGSERRAAQHADIEAAAAAHRAGKPDPGPKQVEAIDAKIRDLTRKRDVLRLAQLRAAEDMDRLIAQHRGEWVEATRAKVAKERVRLGKLAESWAEVRHAVVELEALARWVDSFPTRPSYNLGGNRMRVHGRRFENLTADQALALLLEDAAPREPVADAEQDAEPEAEQDE
jgi:hypothetical protein